MKKRPAIKPISFLGTITRICEQIQVENINYKTVQVKVFETCNVVPPILDPLQKTDGEDRGCDQDERLLAYIKEFAKIEDEVCMHNGKLTKVLIPKKTINLVVSIPLAQQLIELGLAEEKVTE